MSSYINHKFTLDTYQDFLSLLTQNSDVYYNCQFNIKYQSMNNPVHQPVDIPDKLYGAMIIFVNDPIQKIENGGTGAQTQQQAINNLVGDLSNNKFLKANGTDVSMQYITKDDIPQLISSDTTGCAATLHPETMLNNTIIQSHQNNIIKSNVEPGALGNIMVSNGIEWTSQQQTGVLNNGLEDPNNFTIERVEVIVNDASHDYAQLNNASQDYASLNTASLNDVQQDAAQSASLNIASLNIASLNIASLNTLSDTTSLNITSQPTTSLNPLSDTVSQNTAPLNITQSASQNIASDSLIEPPPGTITTDKLIITCGQACYINNTRIITQGQSISLIQNQYETLLYVYIDHNGQIIASSKKYDITNNIPLYTIYNSQIIFDERYIGGTKGLDASTRQTLIDSIGTVIDPNGFKITQPLGQLSGWGMTAGKIIKQNTTFNIPSVNLTSMQYQILYLEGDEMRPKWRLAEVNNKGILPTFSRIYHNKLSSVKQWCLSIIDNLSYCNQYIVVYTGGIITIVSQRSYLSINEAIMATFEDDIKLIDLFPASSFTVLYKITYDYGTPTNVVNVQDARVVNNITAQKTLVETSQFTNLLTKSSDNLQKVLNTIDNSISVAQKPSSLVMRDTNGSVIASNISSEGNITGTSMLANNLSGTTRGLLYQSGNNKTTIIEPSGSLGMIISLGNNIYNHQIYTTSMASRDIQDLKDGPFGGNYVVYKYKKLTNRLVINGYGFFLINYVVNVSVADGNFQTIGMQFYNDSYDDNAYVPDICGSLSTVYAKDDNLYTFNVEKTFIIYQKQDTTYVIGGTQTDRNQQKLDGVKILGYEVFVRQLI